MENPLGETFECDSIKLFNKGACHVFAWVVNERYPSEKNELYRVEVKTGTGEEHLAYHVVLVRYLWMVDVCGIKRTDDYRNWLYEKKKVKVFDQVTYPSIEFEKVDAGDLLMKVCKDTNGEELNAFNLRTDEAFVKHSKKKAEYLVDHFEEKYNIDFQLKGEKHWNNLERS